MSDINLPSTNPSYFLRAIQSNKLNDLYWTWFSKLPENWIETFVEEGLLPFLNQYGYSVGFSKKEIINYCKSWAFGHVQLALNKSKLLINLKSLKISRSPTKKSFLLKAFPSTTEKKSFSLPSFKIFNSVIFLKKKPSP